MEAGFSISLIIAGHLFESRDFSIQKAFFLTESERSRERLLEAARRVSGSESIHRIFRVTSPPSRFATTAGQVGW